MNRPMVSVIVPIYNVEKYIHRCIDSIINQTLKNIEIILVDDQSPDNCPEICEEYAKRDKRIKVIHKMNEGLGLARNSGLDVATGEYVAFIDSDDFLERTAFEQMYEFSKQAQADMCMAGYYKYFSLDEKRTRIEIFKEKQIFENDNVKEIAYKMIGSLPEDRFDSYYSMSVWKNLYSLDFLRNHNIRFCSERDYVSEDAIFHLYAVPKMKKVVAINNCYYYYCDNGDISLTSTFKDEKFEQYKKLYFKELDILKEFNLQDEGNIYISRIFLGNIRNHMKQLASSEYTLLRKIKRTRQICNDNLVKDILSWYPYRKNPFSQKIYSFILKHKLVITALILARVQSKRK